MITRRQLVAAAPLIVAPGIVRATFDHDPLAAIEGTLGPHARVGVAALDTATGRALARRAHERFAFCSTIKLPLVAAILAEADAGRLALDRRIAITAEALTVPAPMVSAAKGGALTVSGLCRAAILVSDNAAANLLFPMVGGPPGLTRFMHAHGGAPTRSDRIETELNTNLPGDPRDTTTPAAMLALTRALLLGSALSPASAALLTGWLAESFTGARRLRAGLPLAWHVADKTGTGERGAVNDVAIAWPAPRRAPLIIACYVDAPGATRDAAETAHALVARTASGRLT